MQSCILPIILGVDKILKGVLAAVEGKVLQKNLSGGIMILTNENVKYCIALWWAETHQGCKLLRISDCGRNVREVVLCHWNKNRSHNIVAFSRGFFLTSRRQRRGQGPRELTMNEKGVFLSLLASLLPSLALTQEMKNSLQVRAAHSCRGRWVEATTNRAEPRSACRMTFELAVLNHCELSQGCGCTWHVQVFIFVGHFALCNQAFVI